MPGKDLVESNPGIHTSYDVAYVFLKRFFETKSSDPRHMNCNWRRYGI